MAGAVWRRPSVILGTLLLVGVSMLYLRLWIVDYGFSSQEREFLRRQFDRASMDAMDESAHWRNKYDAEVARLLRVEDDLARANKTLATLQQENASLRAQMAALQSARHTSADPS